MEARPRRVLKNGDDFGSAAMNPMPSSPARPALRRARRTVMVVDMVESVRLIEADEDDTVRRWQRLVWLVRTRLLPARQGRLVKSLGDGLLCAFAVPCAALGCALEMQGAARALNDGCPPERAIRLRIGVHAAEVIVDELDLYGHGVNLAARLTALAAPGGIVVSAPTRAELVGAAGLCFEDLGETRLRHLRAPVRAYRVDAATPDVLPARPGALARIAAAARRGWAARPDPWPVPTIGPAAALATAPAAERA